MRADNNISAVFGLNSPIKVRRMETATSAIMESNGRKCETILASEDRRKSETTARGREGMEKDTSFGARGLNALEGSSSRRSHHFFAIARKHPPLAPISPRLSDYSLPFLRLAGLRFTTRHVRNKRARITRRALK